jgi:2-iminobutanoate/2-iminopropanoate deaminase
MESMRISTVQTDDAPAAVGPYSQAVKAGSLLFCSGQIPLDPDTGALVEGDITAAAEQALENLGAVLAAAGASPSQVVRTTVYLVDMADFAAVNAAYARFFGNHKPARACVQVSALPKGATVEIDAIAVLSNEVR